MAAIKPDNGEAPMKRLRIAAVAALAAAWGFTPAGAQEATLIFATTNAPQAHLNARVHHPWAKRINEQGAGTLKLDVRDGPTIANHLNFYQRVMDDVIQVAWGLPVYVAGKFPLTEVAALPLVADRAEHASTAMWRLYKSGLLSNEYDEITVLHIIVFPQVSVHYVKPPKTLESLTGLKIGVGNKVSADVVTRLGGNPVSMPLTDYYEALQRGTIDGTISQWTQFQPFKLAEVMFHHTETPLGGNVGMTFMAKKKFDGLSPAARKLLEDNSGEKQSRLFGQFWDQVNLEGRDLAKGDKHSVIKLTPEQEAAWRKRVDPLVEEWAKTSPAHAKTLATFRAEIAKVKAGN
jgi:TRAP-type C4-dicarboxylate transport system substrate-binding protein